MRFGTSNDRSLYRSRSLTTVARELASINEIIWCRGGWMEQRGHHKSRGIIFFSMEKEMKIISWEQDFLYTREYCQQLRE